MNQRSISIARPLIAAAFGAAILTTATMAPSSAQLRDRIKNKVIDDVADQMVSTVQSDSCPEFAAMLKKQRSSSGSSGGKASGMMKKDPAARQRFVDKVAGPLLNKMIDCDMLPNR